MSTTSSRNRAGRLLLGVLAVMAAVVALTGPTSAQAPGDDDSRGPAPERSSRIVGGTVAYPGAWPSQVALLYSSVPDEFAAWFCGGSVINRSWILTAAHCVLDDNYRLLPSGLDILVGTQTLDGSGTRIRAVEIRVHPRWTPDTEENDLALVRLDHPTVQPSQPFLSQGTTIAGGTDLVATGWGDQGEGKGDYSEQLRQVTVPQQTDAQCSTYYGPEFKAASMTCAGEAGSDTCQGDSGGPLVVYQGGTYVQAGITSWGVGCARGDFPGIYTRVAAYSTYLKQQIRYGPHPDAGAFVRRMHLDLFNRQPTNAELFYGITGLNDGTPNSLYARNLIQTDAYQRRTGGVTRLYRALFLRDPDTPGLAYWWGQVNSRRSLQRIANIMAASSEFRERYGDLSNDGYVDLVYQNVLNRPPDEAGRAFWVGELDSGRRTRGEMMAGFTESSEYRNATNAPVNVIITYFGLLRRVATPAEITTWQSQSNQALASSLLSSFSYADRF